jgi:hypothetical protein
MAMYHRSIERYEGLAKQLFDLLPEDKQAEGAELIARVINAGVVCNPGKCQAVVRLNIVNGLLKGVDNINCRIVKREMNPGQPDTRLYNALVVDHTTPQEKG